MDINDLAQEYNMDAGALARRFAVIRQQYIKKESEYIHLPNAQDYKEELEGIKSKANSLFAAMDSARTETRMRLQGDDKLIHHTSRHLHALVDRIESTAIVIKGRKPMFHKNLLVLRLRKVWKDFTGEPANKSSSPKSFRSFMEDACFYMEIDGTGLWDRHRKGLN